MRTELSATDLTADALYRLLTATVVPRPIAWVSTRSADGVDNLAPHSFFTVSCVRPPIVQFTSVGVKDTLRNVRERGEFVIAMATQALTNQVNACATDFPPELGEFDQLGIEREPALTVAPPRVAASPVAIECRVHDLIELGDSTLVLGRVLHVALEPAVTCEVRGEIHPQIELLAPMSRLGGSEWAGVGQVRSLRRVPWTERRQHRQP